MVSWIKARLGPLHQWQAPITVAGLVQEARSRAARTSTPCDKHSATLAHELDIARRQLAEARTELEFRQGSGAYGGAEPATTHSTPPLRQAPLWSPSTTAHSQDSQHRFGSDHAVLTEQVRLYLSGSVAFLPSNDHVPGSDSEGLENILSLWFHWKGSTLCMWC